MYRGIVQCSAVEVVRSAEEGVRSAEEGVCSAEDGVQCSGVCVQLYKARQHPS